MKLYQQPLRKDDGKRSPTRAVAALGPLCRMPPLERVRQQGRRLPQEVSPPRAKLAPKVVMCRELTRDERKGIRKLVTEDVRQL